MENILKPTVLKINKLWQSTSYCTIKKAIINMCSNDFASGVLGMDIEYGINSLTGDYDFDNPISIRPVTWEEWINLPIRPYDNVVQGACRVIRAPTTVIAINHSKMPMTEKSPSKTNIFERDGGICQYTGKKLNRKNSNVDHVIPRDCLKEVRGDAEGLNHWENLVLSDKDLNSRKGNRLNEEIGLKLIRKPKAPPPMPISFYAKEVKHQDHKIFMLPT